MFQSAGVDLAQQLQGLHLKGAALDQAVQVVQGGPWPQQQAQQHAVPSLGGGKDAGQALLKLLQSSGGRDESAAQQQRLPPPQQGQQQQPNLLSAPFLNGATLPPQQPHSSSAGLFSGGLLPGGDPSGGPAPQQQQQQPLPSLFTGNSIWSTSGPDGGSAGAANSLWGNSIWSSQQTGWSSQPGLQPQGPEAQAQQQQLPMPPQLGQLQQQAAGLAPPGPQGQRLSPPPQLQQQHGYGAPPLYGQPVPQRLQPQAYPPGFGQPLPLHGQPPPPYPQHALAHMGGHPQQQQQLPFSAPPPGFPGGFPLGVQQPGLLGPVAAGPRLPQPPGAVPPPPPPNLAHAPKFATAQQAAARPLMGQAGLGLEERLKQAAAAQPQLAQQSVPLPPYAQQPGAAAGAKQLRHQQLRAGGGFQQYAPKQAGAAGSRWVEVSDRAQTARLPRGDLAQLDARLVELAESLAPTDEEKQRQRVAFARVREVLQARWPASRVHLFGSVANGLSVRSNNDLDVCLEMRDVGDDQAAKGEVASEVGEVLKAAAMAEVLPLPKARVPVVKFVVPETGTKVDVTVNNMLACLNTKLLADYAAIDPRLSQLVAVVKHWAKQRAVNDSYRGTLSSYCYVLMCINLLQTRSPPVLPSLQQMPATFRAQVGQWRVEFFDQVEALRDFGADNSESLAQLVWSFFEYWAWRHDYATDVVSVRTGGCLRKEDKDWTRRIGNERHLVCIEDPFELSHDLGRTVDRQTKSVLHKEFIRAASLLRDSPDPLEKLFEPYRAGRS